MMRGAVLPQKTKVFVMRCIRAHAPGAKEPMKQRRIVF